MFAFNLLRLFIFQREIAFTRQLNKLDPEIKWYYLGFYAHECRKMRYKVRSFQRVKEKKNQKQFQTISIQGQFSPSFLLCPEAFSWHPIDHCFKLLSIKKYSRFSDKDAKDVDLFKDINEIKIRGKFRESEPKVFRFNEFCRFLNASFVPQFSHLINGYCKLFGRDFSKRVLINFQIIVFKPKH